MASTKDDIFEITVVEAKSAFTKKNSGYCSMRSNFSPQQFRTVSCQKTHHPHWGQTFRFFTADNPPTGNVSITVHQRGFLWWDSKVGEVVVNVAEYGDGDEHDFWLNFQNEPRSKSGARGEMHLRAKFMSIDPNAAPVPSIPFKRDGGSVAHFKPPPTPVHAASVFENGSSASAGSGGASTPSSPSSNRGSARMAAANPASPGRGGQNSARTDSDAAVLTVEDKYEMIKEIGRGAFATVFKARNKFTDEEVAIKVVNKQNVKEKELEMLTREIKIIKRLKHKYIVRLLDLFDGPRKLYIVLELVPGGELFDKIVKNGAYSEEDARNMIRQVLEGVEYMHSHGVVHRDLKPENLLCMNDTHVKIADFGMSKDITQMGPAKTAVGTPSYIAPEIIKGLNKVSYDSACDIWSVGILSYVLLCGFTPFWGDSQKQLFDKITKLDYEFPSPEWDNISPLAQQFVKYLLVLDPADRPSAQQCLEHDWIKLNEPVRGNKLSHATKNLAIMQTKRIVERDDEDDNDKPF